MKKRFNQYPFLISLHVIDFLAVIKGFVLQDFFRAWGSTHDPAAFGAGPHFQATDLSEMPRNVELGENVVYKPYLLDTRCHEESFKTEFGRTA